MTLSELLARFPDREPQADGVLVHCPAHTDTQASLRLSVSDRGKVLVRCRAGCDTAKVVAALGMSMRGLATMTAGDVDFQPATSQDVPASPSDVAALAVELDRHAAAFAGSAAGVYAEERFGLSADDAERLGLGYAPGMAGADRLVVPFRDRRGVARGFQARAIGQASVRWYGPKSPDGATWAKIGWLPGSAGWDEVLVTEGPGDGLTACALGYDAIVVRGAGLAANPAVVAQIVDWLADRVAVLAGDGDPSGRAFSATLARSIVDAGGRAKILDVPDGLDLSDWRKTHGPAAFSRELIRSVLAAPEQTTATATLSARDLSRYPLSDLGNARFVRDFITARGSGVRYSPEAGFFLLHGGVWRTDRLDRTRAYVQDAADKVAAIARQVSDTATADPQSQAEAKRWLRWATYSQSMQGINAAIRELQALPDVSADLGDFDKHPHYLACLNGVVDLRSGELLSHDPSLLITRQIQFDYRPSAKAPRWLQFLAEVFPKHLDLPDYVQRLIGYGITGSTAEQCFAVLWGSGANGKSVFTDTLTEVFREATVTTPFSTFEERPSGGIPNDIAALKGARLVMASEGEAGKPMAEAMLKRVTGRDLISARFMRKEFFEFRPTFLLMLATNTQPNFRGQDEGLWRRVKMIPWDRFFAPHERDHRLGDTLLAEAEGIVAWAVAGAVEWYANGLQDPKVITSATAEYREASDALAGFFPGEYVRDDAGRIKAPDLFKAFQEWTDEHNLQDLQRWSSRRFYSELSERKINRRKSGGAMYAIGIRRAKVADRAVDEEEPDTPEAAEPLTPLRVPETAPKPISGASLGDVF